MSTITDEITFFNFVTTAAWLGKYAASTGTQDINNSTLAQNTSLVDFNSNVKLTHGFNTYYKMQGFNASTNSYQVWFSTGAPLLIPPSGDALSNIEIVLTWIDR